MNFHFEKGANELDYLYFPNIYINGPNYIIKALYKNFTPRELKILMNHLSLFVENEAVRKFFPRVEHKKSTEVFGKDIKEEAKNWKEKLEEYNNLKDEFLVKLLFFHIKLPVAVLCRGSLDNNPD